MAKITKVADAPEGVIKVSIANKHFTVSDDKPYETDDLLVIDAVQRSSADYLQVEFEESGDLKEALRQEREEERELTAAQAAAHKQRAEKDPREPAAAIPQTAEDLKKNEGGKS